MSMVRCHHWGVKLIYLILGSTFVDTGFYYKAGDQNSNNMATDSSKTSSVAEKSGEDGLKETRVWMDGW